MRLVCLLAVVLAAGCNRGEERAAPSPARVTAPAEAEEVVASSPAPPLFERHAALPEPERPPLEVPVEEDFISEAEQRISKNAKLELELARLKQEIQAERE